ncbi:MAG: hypothetical protein RI101_14115 [Nitrospira sp.]|nr:hypothetical protein [Nitrospira sp.]
MAAFVLLCVAPLGAQDHEPTPDVTGESAPHHGHDSASSSDGWEGSKEGIAYSEFNHHLAGFFVLLIGLSELVPALRISSGNWARMLLPGALILMGVFLLVWSDHQAWPVGPMTFAQTFWGDDPEILQHKLYGMLSLTVGLIEVFRRLDRVVHAGWMAPLPAFAILGGLMLFAHSHGAHPSAQKIALDHAIMGTLAISAGSTKLVSVWLDSILSWSRARGEIVWAVFILAIGLQLLLYSE